jgi:F-type H+-transporting ATPase subunit c
MKKMIAVMTTLLGLTLFSLVASAQDHGDDHGAAAAVVAGADTLGDGLLGPHEAHRGVFVALAMGLGLGLAALGGTMAQGRATSAALEGLSRNPGSYDRLFTPFILGLVLIESLVIYSLVISLILLGSLGG